MKIVLNIFTIFTFTLINLLFCTEEFKEKNKAISWTVTGNKLRIRSKPHLKSKIIGQLNAGEIVTETQRTKNLFSIDMRNAPWVFIKTDKNVTGWVFGGFLSIDALSITTVKTENLCKDGKVHIKTGAQVYSNPDVLQPVMKINEPGMHTVNYCNKINPKNFFNQKFVQIQFPQLGAEKYWLQIKDAAFPNIVFPLKNFELNGEWYYNLYETCYSIHLLIQREKGILYSISDVQCAMENDVLKCTDDMGGSTYYGGKFTVKHRVINAITNRYYGNDQTGLLQKGILLNQKDFTKETLFRCGQDALCTSQKEPLFRASFPAFAD